MIIVFIAVAFVVLVMAEDRDSYIFAIIITICMCLTGRPESILVGIGLVAGLTRMTK